MTNIVKILKTRSKIQTFIHEVLNTKAIDPISVDK